jgi:branched-chain amino acid transport system permease protein
MMSLFQTIQQWLTKCKAGIYILLVLSFLPPLITSNQYILHLLITIGLFIVLSLSLNLVTGYAGQFSMGHAAFYGIGAYVAALSMLKLGFSFWLAMLASATFTCVSGLFLGLPALRLQGDYLGIVTLGFGEIVRLVFVNWVSVTRGPMGLPGIPSPQIGSFVFADKSSYYYIVLALVLFTIITMHRMITGRFGLQLATVREDEVAATAMGINITRVKIFAFCIGAFYAGLTGAVFACYMSFVSPDSFMYIDSVTILAMIVLGGLCSIPGSIIGAVVLVLVPEFMRFMADYRMVLYGLLMIVVMIFKPEGFWSGRYRVKNYWLRAIGEKNYGNS